MVVRGKRSRVVRPTSLACVWCGTQFSVHPAGRVPKFCSVGCRHRSWEQDRAASSGRSAVRVIERVLPSVVPAPRLVPATEAGERADEWVEALAQLTGQLHAGYLDRHLNQIIDATDALRAEAAGRRAWNVQAAVKERQRTQNRADIEADATRWVMGERAHAVALSDALAAAARLYPSTAPANEWATELVRFGIALRDNPLTEGGYGQVDLYLQWLVSIVHARGHRDFPNHHR